ncbi:MAG: hypothetical protein ACREN2_10440, partial [Candidatus Dormibacteria bacterium]
MTRPITTELIARTGTALADGGWRYTSRQLYYATCAAAETPRRSPARGQFAVGVLLGLVALILIPIHVAAVALGALAVLSIASAVVSLLTFKPATGRPLPLSFPEFEALLASEEPSGALIDATEPATPIGATGDVLIVCDTAENASAAGANVVRALLSHVAVTTADTPVREGSTVIALHDASPRGCALTSDLADAGCRVIDAGLRPAWVAGAGVQTLEGAAARMPRDLSPALSDA